MTAEVCVRKTFMDGRSVTPTAPLGQRMSAFRGATLGVAVPGDSSDRIIRWLLAKYGGLNPDTDTTIVPIGSGAALPGALQAGTIQGYLLPPPACGQAAGGGVAEVIAKPTDVPEFKHYIDEVLVVNRNWAAAHGELASRMAIALAMGNAELLQHPEASAALLRQSGLANVDGAAIKDILLPQVPRDGRMSGYDWKTTNAVLAESGMLKESLDIAEGGVWTNAYLPSGGAAVQ